MVNEKLEVLVTLLKTMVEAIATKPENVKIHAENLDYEGRGETTVINIKVAPEDIPLCIGAGGITADAMRRVIMLTSKKISYDTPLFIRVDAPRMLKNHFEFEK
jgi:predicted RNA-binding protein YlqC (UPF0109 family)